MSYLLKSDIRITLKLGRPKNIVGFVPHGILYSITLDHFDFQAATNADSG